MKLRIQENSLRLRLTRKEVAHLLDHGVVESAVQFGAGRCLHYSLAASPVAFAISADYEGDAVRVVLPGAVATTWAESSDVTLEADYCGVRILVEKDFQCLHGADERDPDGYPNPFAKDR